MSKQKKTGKYYYNGKQVEVVNDFLETMDLSNWGDLLEDELSFENAFLYVGFVSGLAQRLTLHCETARCEVVYWYTYDESIDEVEINGFIAENTYSEVSFEQLAECLEENISDDREWMIDLLMSADGDGVVGFFSEYFAEKICDKLEQLRALKAA